MNTLNLSNANRFPTYTRRVLRAAALAFLATLAFGSLSPPSAVGAEKAIWGPLTMPDGSNAFPLYRRLGVDTFQIQLSF